MNAIELIESVKKRADARSKLISWLKLLRSPQDVGIGDTANRLRRQRKKTKVGETSDAHDAVNRLLRQCSCSRVDAVARLNQQWPY